jgi:Reverse transcriptase (RNA-dependent DNA polymerase)
MFKKKDDTVRVRYKIRFVAKDYSHIKGIDFNEVFSSMIKHTSI